MRAIGVCVERVLVGGKRTVVALVQHARELARAVVDLALGRGRIQKIQQPIQSAQDVDDAYPTWFKYIVADNLNSRHYPYKSRSRNPTAVVFFVTHENLAFSL
jgi:hypothetical protein